MSSSGCARAETLSLTVQQYIESTKEYHNSDNIQEAIQKMYDKDVVPIFYLKRIKTNKHYYTFCSPEANQEIMNYLLTREDLTEDNLNNIPLFKCNVSYFERQFARINSMLGLGKIGAHNKFKSHSLRKFHATNLYNDNMSLEEIDKIKGYWIIFKHCSRINCLNLKLTHINLKKCINIYIKNYIQTETTSQKIIKTIHIKIFITLTLQLTQPIIHIIK